jgi:hypothetical protein
LLWLPACCHSSKHTGQFACHQGLPGQFFAEGINCVLADESELVLSVSVLILVELFWQAANARNEIRM